MQTATDIIFNKLYSVIDEIKIEINTHKKIAKLDQVKRIIAAIESLRMAVHEMDMNYVEASKIPNLI